MKNQTNNRRDFLKRTGLAGISLVGASMITVR